jgi:hypothetical protein
MMTFGQIPRNMADILMDPSSTSVESVSTFVKRLQELVTSAVTSIDQANKTAEGYANRSRLDFQFDVGDVHWGIDVLSEVMCKPAIFTEKHSGSFLSALANSLEYIVTNSFPDN